MSYNHLTRDVTQSLEKNLKTCQGLVISLQELADYNDALQHSRNCIETCNKNIEQCLEHRLVCNDNFCKETMSVLVNSCKDMIKSCHEVLQECQTASHKCVEISKNTINIADQLIKLINETIYTLSIKI